MSHKKFVEQFPSIPQSNEKVCILTPCGWAIVEEAVRKYCLDKQEVKKAIENHLRRIESGELFIKSARHDKEELLKELGL